MSDDPAAPSGPKPIPLSQAQPFRPPATRKAPPPAKPPSNVKKVLVIGIIVSTVILIPLVAWRVYVKLTVKVVPPRNVKVEWENAWQLAKGAHREMFAIQSKAWV